MTKKERVKQCKIFSFSGIVDGMIPSQHYGMGLNICNETFPGTKKVFDPISFFSGRDANSGLNAKTSWDDSPAPTLNNPPKKTSGNYPEASLLK